MKSLNSKRFDEASKKLKELTKKYPKLKTAVEIGYICGMINHPLSPIYDSEKAYCVKFEKLEKLLEEL